MTTLEQKIEKIVKIINVLHDSHSAISNIKNLLRLQINKDGTAEVYTAASFRSDYRHDTYRQSEYVMLLNFKNQQWQGFIELLPRVEPLANQLLEYWQKKAYEAVSSLTSSE